MATPDVLIVGAGLAGLCCARQLHEHGLSCQILEASDGVGGRVRTDGVDGFLLDRGFQVLLTAYPEAQQRLDYPARGHELRFSARASLPALRGGAGSIRLLSPIDGASCGSPAIDRRGALVRWFASMVAPIQ